ncbi:hypothetical protein A3D78_00255 [Candidatus Gottesmanbacteria bacterium RIFCSPHIGHO2_02_FULL_39_14]|uniref:Glycosyl transferase family 1 domain-containing protein n=1 Tax=Candidatus Gottesmanbacteria bacterium RIFCSPHIGHO2_02_FULL_39_14 TaxID=1798383 RepID=A0A1F5ZVU3_9BACT|nr:MAG: hypothetical protein A3D78_00255 [Candidatus Gottesmanbacteria bacterium RIFCSPHIGHO2_02_FULL_39_14]
MRKKVVIVAHALIASDGKAVYGTGSSLESYLEGKDVDYLLVKHPIFGAFPTQVSGRINNGPFFYKLERSNSQILPLKTLQEMIITFKLIKKYFSGVDIYLGIDPLNALFGILIKKINRIDSIIFYTADYAVKRFDNIFLNFFYHFTDRFVIKLANEVWNVSSRIAALRLKQGVDRQRNFFVPNSPFFHKIKRLTVDQINKHEMVLVSTSPKSTDFSLIFQAIRILTHKYPDIRLKIIGLANWQETFSHEIDRLAINKNIVFHSRMPHKKLLNIFCRAAVGLALYTNQYSWTYFSDSMKARDYLACGLPVIMTDISSTAKDIRKSGAGLVIRLGKNDLVQAIDKLFSSHKYYRKLRINALNLAEKNDIGMILNSRLRLL